MQGKLFNYSQLLLGQSKINSISLLLAADNIGNSISYVLLDEGLLFASNQAEILLLCYFC